MNNKNNTPTIEESLEMIEKKLESQKKNKITNKSNDKKDSSLKKDNTKISSLSNLFKFFVGTFIKIGTSDLLKQVLYILCVPFLNILCPK